MKVRFLGTGTSQGIPVVACDCDVCNSDDPRDTRFRSSVLVEVRGRKFVIDTGPDFRMQMLAAKQKSIDAILLTHGHKDHVGGLDDVRAFNFKLKRPMDVYAKREVLDQLKKEFSYAFAKSKYPGVPQIILNEIENQPFTIDNIPIIPIEVKHFRMPILGYRIGNFTYLTDLNYISYEEKQKVLGTDVLVVTALRKQLHYSHFNLEQALELIEELKPKRAYLTHVSHLMGKQSDVEKELPDNVFFAHDGLELEL